MEKNIKIINKNSNNKNSNDKNSNDKNSNIVLNGPLNYLELYNSDTKQKLWLFMDNHKNVTRQKKCEDYEAKDIDKYLYKILSESSDILDFFLEINPTDIINEDKFHSNDNYILETRKIFRKIYKEQQIKKNNNIRLHYIDIRDYSFYNELLMITMNLVNEVDQYKLLNLNYLIKELRYISSKLIFINLCIDKIKKNENIDVKNFDVINFKILPEKNNIYNKSQTNGDDKITDKEKNNENQINNNSNNLNDNQKKIIGFFQLLGKILNKYSDDYNKDKILNFFDNNYVIESNEAINLIKELLINLEEINKILDYQVQNDQLNIDKMIINEKKNIVHKFSYYGINQMDYNKFSRIVYNELIKIDLLLLRLGTIFMDSFFLRRIIEKKDYIKKSIIYTGGYHTIVYIWFLIKYYNFEITDYYYINLSKLGVYDDEDINKINLELKNIIDNSKNINDLFELFMPKIFNQCVKIKNIA
jgi:hypothetical protein